MTEKYIEIDDSTSFLLDAIASAEDDAVLLATLAEIDPDEFRQFMTESGERTRDAARLLKAAELLQARAKEQEMQYRKDSGDSISNKLTYLLIGGGIGSILALLFAPKSVQELRAEIADATRQGIDRSREAAQQLGDRAGEYYEATRGRAAELYSQASEKVSDVAQSARDAASRQTGTLTAAIDAGKKAYQEEKRKTEMSGRIDAPNFGDESTN